jgi:hypothetical protein
LSARETFATVIVLTAFAFSSFTSTLTGMVTFFVPSVMATET